MNDEVTVFGPENAAIGADTADSIACTFYCTAGGTVLYGATIVPPRRCHRHSLSRTHRIRDGDIFHGAARANAAEQTNVVLIDINVQPSDGVDRRRQMCQ